MPPVGFEPTISAGERPKTYALDCAATGIGSIDVYLHIIALQLIYTYTYSSRGELQKGYLVTISGATT